MSKEICVFIEEIEYCHRGLEEHCETDGGCGDQKCHKIWHKFITENTIDKNYETIKELRRRLTLCVEDLITLRMPESAKYHQDYLDSL